MDYPEMFREAISEELRFLSWTCTKCKHCKSCEDQSPEIEARYCWPMIEAAILGNRNWEVPNSQKIKE